MMGVLALDRLDVMYCVSIAWRQCVDRRIVSKLCAGDRTSMMLELCKVGELRLWTWVRP